MTHKDFVLIAAALARAKADPLVVNEMADALRPTNSRFDRNRFIAAASGKPTTGRDKPRR